MKTIIFSLLLAIPTVRSGLTGKRIDGAHANKPIAVLIISNTLIYASDEIIVNMVTGHRTVPIIVWRDRSIRGISHTCKVDTFNIEIPNDKAVTPPQIFIIPADMVKEFDTFLFESRPWYSITTSNSPVGTGINPSKAEDLLAVPVPFPGTIFDCN